MTTMPDYYVCCLQSVISHYQEMSPSNLLVIVLILTGVPPIISQGICYPDLWSCLLDVTIYKMHGPWIDWCRRDCMYKGMHGVLCPRIHDRCYDTCRCHY